MEKFFPRVFYRVKFEVILPIDNLEYYQGVYWSAMLRHWCRPYFHAPLSELGLFPVPVHNGMQEYHTGELLALDLSIPAEHQSTLLAILNDELKHAFKAVPPEGRLHFYPGRSLRLISYEQLSLSVSKRIIDIESILQEASFLKDHFSSLDLVFHTPLRQKPSAESRQNFSFLDPLGFDAQSFFPALCRDFNIKAESYPQLENKGCL